MSKQIREEMKRFNYLTAEIDAAYHEAALRLGLSDSAMQVLYTVCDKGGECFLSDIPRLSGISKQTVNSALRKLEREGDAYLECSGARRKKLCLTPKGRALAERTVLRIMKIENEIFGSWKEAERDAYLELTQRYLSALQEKIKEL